MPTILGANTLSSGYDVANSLRFNRGSEDYLDRTPSSAGNQKKFTFSTWIKRSTIGAGSGPEEFIMYGRPGSNTDTRLYFTGDGNANDDRLYFQSTTSNTSHTSLQTNRKFRDTSAWYNIVISANTEDGNGSSSTIKIFVNGVQETSFATENYGSQNSLFYWTDDALTTIGRRSENNGQHFHGYIAETVLIDGQALDADSFGEFNSDSPTIWQPKDVSGLTFGTTGFYLEFKQSGTSQNSSGMGADTSGNDNHFTVNNLTAVDQSTDTCTNNFATIINASAATKTYTLSEGNLKITASSNSWHGVPRGSIGVSSGKWYYEVKVTDENNNFMAGYMSADNLAEVGDVATNGFSKLNGFQSSGYIKRQDGSEGNISGSFQWNDGDIAQIALDMDNKKLWIGKAGSYYNSGDPAAGSNETIGSSYFTAGGTYLPALIFYGTNDGSFNFGSPPYSESGGNSDANGYGNFNQAVPSGFYALNTKNLAEFG